VLGVLIVVKGERVDPVKREENLNKRGVYEYVADHSSL
jgi:hypothetical protein